MSFQCYIINESYSNEVDLLKPTHQSIYLGKRRTLQKAKKFVEKIFSDFNYIEEHDLTTYFFTMNLQIKIIDSAKNLISSIAILPGSTQKLHWTVDYPFHIDNEITVKKVSWFKRWARKIEFINAF